MMKTRLILCLIFAFMIGLAGAVTITGNPVITGEATSADASLSLTIVGGVPTISIISPENGTYLKRNILINYTVTNGGACNYSVNDSANTTILTPTSVTFAEGFNTLYLWANSSNGSLRIYDTVNFTVNTSLLTILYTNFNGSKKGSSTDFYSYPYLNLTNLSGITLEHTDYGKIVFNDAINVSNDSDNDDGEVDINTNIFILDNFIYLDSTDLPNFNTSATVYIYNLSYSNPRILRNDEACPSTICTGKTYNSDTGTLYFDVTGFSKYSADETPTETTTVNVGGSGSGGGGVTIDRHLEIIVGKVVEIGIADLILVPIKFYNPEVISLEEIKLRAVSLTPYLGTMLEETELSRMGPGDNRTMMLFLKSFNESVVGDYEVRIEASINRPRFTEKETFQVQLKEVLGGSEILERIILAEDLFRENPQCLELNDLLIEARRLNEEGNTKDAITLVQTAIYQCQEMVTSKEYPFIASFGALSKWRIILEVVLGLVVVTLIIVAFLRKPKFDLYKAKKE